MNADSLLHFIQILPIGLASGILAGAFGVGGGIIAVPVVRHLLGVTAHVAVGSTLAMILPTAVAAVFNYKRQGKLHLSLSLACCLPAVLGTTLASHHSRSISERFLMLLLAFLMVIVGLDFVSGIGARLKSKANPAEAEVRGGEDNIAGKSKGGESFTDERPDNNDASHNQTNTLVFRMRHYLVAAAIGVVVGLLSGLLGIGGGFIMVPAFCYFLNLPLKDAFGTSLLVVAVVALPGSVVHYMHGHVDFSLVLPLLSGSVPGAWFGSSYALKAKEKNLRIVFGVIVILMAAVFAYKELRL